MLIADIAVEITQDIAAEQTRRDQLIAHFAAAMAASLEHEARLRARLDQLPADGVATVLDPIKDTRSAPVVVVEILDLAGRDGLSGGELNRRARQRGLNGNTIEQAKQRLKEGKKVALENGVWRHQRFATATPTAAQIFPAKRPRRGDNDRKPQARKSGGAAQPRSA